MATAWSTIIGHFARKASTDAREHSASTSRPSKSDGSIAILSSFAWSSLTPCSSRSASPPARGG
eukprot:scaffold2226_cov28-Tisochrysis_lutea.AAC.1